MRKKNGGNSSAKNIALGGVFSALAVVIMLAGGLISIGTFAAPIFAGICLLPIAMDIGAKWAFLCYVAVTLLSALMVPDQELVLFFILLFGYYPMLRPLLEKIKSKVLRLAAKLVIFNVAVAAVYGILLWLLASPAIIGEFAGYGLWFIALLLAMGNATFILYDILLDKVRYLYITRVRKYIFR